VVAGEDDEQRRGLELVGRVRLAVGSRQFEVGRGVAAVECGVGFG